MHAFAALLGTIEIAAALLIAIRPIAPRISAVGSMMSVLLFLSTLSFVFTTPRLDMDSGGLLQRYQTVAPRAWAPAA